MAARRPAHIPVDLTLQMIQDGGDECQHDNDQLCEKKGNDCSAA